MERRQAELNHLLGEKLSRLECINQKSGSALWSLNDRHGNAMPLLASRFTSPGLSAQQVWKIHSIAFGNGTSPRRVWRYYTCIRIPGKKYC